MLTREEIQTYLNALNDEMATQDAVGELCLFGGTVMCLVYQARPSTKDVDAIFVPTQAIRAAAQKVATTYNLPDDWLNDAVKGFVVPHQQRIFWDFSHLKVYIPEPDYLLAMKAMAARFDTQDADDVKYLIRHLQLQSAEAVFQIIENYYPRQQIRPATRYFVEEIFDENIV
jgi:Nucleotidyltransferase of unknown function (DUF6036)